MAEMAWAITTATPFLCHLFYLKSWSRSSLSSAARNSSADDWHSVITASPHRVAAPCPYFGVCGGCHYQHIPYELQLEYKAAILRETLSRLGRIAWDGPIVPHASPAYGYRNRAQWKIAPQDAGTLAIGYYQAGVAQICAVSNAPSASPLLVVGAAGSFRAARGRKLPRTLLEVEAFAEST